MRLPWTHINILVFIIVASIISNNYASAEYIEMPEVQTLNYDFMNKIAEYIKTTDHNGIYKVIYPELKGDKDGYYYLDIILSSSLHKDYINVKRTKDSFELDKKGSYALTVAFTQYYLGVLTHHCFSWMGYHFIQISISFHIFNRVN